MRDSGRRRGFASIPGGLRSLAAVTGLNWLHFTAPTERRPPANRPAMAIHSSQHRSPFAVRRLAFGAAPVFCILYSVFCILYSLGQLPFHDIPHYFRVISQLQFLEYAG